MNRGPLCLAPRGERFALPAWWPARGIRLLARIVAWRWKKGAMRQARLMAFGQGHIRGGRRRIVRGGPQAARRPGRNPTPGDAQKWTRGAAMAVTRSAPQNIGRCRGDGESWRPRAGAMYLPGIGPFGPRRHRPRVPAISGRGCRAARPDRSATGSGRRRRPRHCPESPAPDRRGNSGESGYRWLPDP